MTACGLYSIENMRSIASLVALLAVLAACESDAKRSERTANPAMSAATAGATATPTESDLEERVEGGVHRLVTTAHGALHLWTPRHYSESGDIVVYVHGDDAWREDLLASRFAASGLDALFIAGGADWGSLAELLGTTHRANPLPTGRVIVVGYSAAQVVPWLAESQLDGLVVMDSVHGDVDRYRTWLHERRDRQLIFVGIETARLHARLPEATVVEKLPALGQARGGRLMLVKSERQSSTMLPVVLQMAGDEGGVPVAQLP